MRTEESLQDHLDLMVDEFERIRNIAAHTRSVTDENEIRGICDRAISVTKQIVPVIKQRDTLTANLEKCVKALEPFKCYADLIPASINGEQIELGRDQKGLSYRVTVSDFRLASTTLAELKQ